jgi:hypothetical protein
MDVANLAALQNTSLQSGSICPGTSSWYSNPSIPLYYDEIYASNQVTGNVLRLAHTFNSGWSYQFDVQNAGVGIQSHTGKWIAFLSDGWGQFGACNGSVGQGACASSTASSNIGGPNWKASNTTDFVTGTGYGSYILPSAGNAAHYIYKVQSCSGSPCQTGATEPTWPQNSTAGTTVTETGSGNITWATAPDSVTPANSAIYNSRAEIMLIQAFQSGSVSAGAPPAPFVISNATHDAPAKTISALR